MNRRHTSFIINQMYYIFTTIFVRINHVNPIETGKITANLFVIKTGTANFFIYKSEEDITGSMSYLINESILIVGDTFRLIKGKACPIKYYNMDTKKQKESIRKLACLDNVELACTAHRGYTGKFNEAIGLWK